MKIVVKLIGVCFLLQTLIFISGCKKRDDKISLDSDNILPSNLTQVDTLRVDASSITEPFVRTDNITQFLAGRMHDPILGISESSIYTQIKMVSTGSIFDLGSGIDSAFLFLAFTSNTDSSRYGNISSVQSFELFEVSENFKLLNPSNPNDVSGRYNSSDSMLVFPTVIGSFSGTYSMADSVSVLHNGTVINAPPGIKISLTKEFAEKLLSGSVDDVKTQADFRNYIKGLCIRPTGNPASGEGAVVAFNLNIDPSKIFVYYDNDKQTNFLIETEERKFAKYSYSNQPSFLVNQKQNLSLHFDTTVVQGLTGAKTHLRFPTLYSLLEEGNIFIHKAEIVIPVIKNTITPQFRASTRLLVVQPDIQNNNQNLNIPDFFYGGNSYGGVYDSEKGEYRFGISQYIQTVIKTKQQGNDFNNGLYIIPTTDLPITPSRVLIDSDQNKPINERLRIIIIYSKL